MTLASINPATGLPLNSYPVSTNAEIEQALADAQHAWPAWHANRPGVRASRLKAVAHLLRERKSSLAILMAREMGKPIRQGEGEIEKCAWACDYFAEHAEALLAPQLIATEASKSYITFQPLGVLLAVMPWNFPFWQVFRAAVPALMAGNAVLLKHAANVTGCALAIEDIFNQANFPTGLFHVLKLPSTQLAPVIAHPAVSAVTLTGSVAAGQEIAAQAGKHLKKTVLELGGSDPYIILEDADLGSAVTACVTSRLINGGQSCIAAKRFIVVESIRAKFTELFVEQMRAQRVGDPLEDETDVGPLARQDLRDALHHQVQRSCDEGAQVLLGGAIPNRPGWFYPPTVLTRVSAGMPVYEEETFGPVAAIIGVPNEEEAIRVANDTVFGLGAAVFTGQPQRGERIAATQLQAGSCSVNDFVRSDPRLPFGGIKQSGYGRELGAIGLREFVNIKTVVVR